MASEREINALFRLSGFEIEPRELTITRDGLTIGRANDNDLALNHAQLSRKHARIFWKEGQYWIEDLNSSNGAWVNDSRIRPSVPQQLRPGDAIRLGPYLLTFLSLLTPAPPLPVDPAFRQELPLPPVPAPVLPPAPELPPAPVQDSEESIAQLYASLDSEAVISEAEKPPVNGAGSTLIDVSTNGAHAIGSNADTPPPPLPSLPAHEPVNDYPVGIPRQRSSWLNYLPAIYSDDEFLGRYLLIFESILDPIIWMIDNFDLYLTPDLAPEEWLRWMASWFDLLIIPDLPSERQRAIVGQLGWLFLRRGTRSGLERLLELYFGVRPEIIENRAEPGHFVVKLPLSESNVRVGREVVEQLIASQKPAFASHTLETT